MSRCWQPAITSFNILQEGSTGLYYRRQKKLESKCYLSLTLWRSISSDPHWLCIKASASVIVNNNLTYFSLANTRWSNTFTEQQCICHHGVVKWWCKSCLFIHKNRAFVVFEKLIFTNKSTSLTAYFKKSWQPAFFVRKEKYLQYKSNLSCVLKMGFHI